MRQRKQYLTDFSERTAWQQHGYKSSWCNAPAIQSREKSLLDRSIVKNKVHCTHHVSCQSFGLEPPGSSPGLNGQCQPYTLSPWHPNHLLVSPLPTILPCQPSGRPITKRRFPFLLDIGAVNGDDSVLLFRMQFVTCMTFLGVGFLCHAPVMFMLLTKLLIQRRVLSRSPGPPWKLDKIPPICYYFPPAPLI